MSFIIDNTVEFVHIPKTAGMWIEQCCQPYITMTPDCQAHGGRHSIGLTSKPSFAVARSPFMWLTSLLAYTKRRWVVVDKGYPGWLLNTPFKKIGMMDVLKRKESTPEDFINEYLDTMPGEYSRAVCEYFRSVDRLVDMHNLVDDLARVLTGFKVPHAGHIINNLEMRPPFNQSRFKLEGLTPKQMGADLVESLQSVEGEYYNHVLARGVDHD